MTAAVGRGLSCETFFIAQTCSVDGPPVATQLDDPTEVASKPDNKLRVATYMDVVSKSSVQSWREHRDSMSEVAIRRGHSSAMTWKGDDVSYRCCTANLIQGTVSG